MLLRNVLLEYTIDLALNRIYENRKVLTSITRHEMREILLICTKNVYFTFRDIVHLKIDGAAIGSTLGPVPAGIFMVHLIGL